MLTNAQILNNCLADNMLDQLIKNVTHYDQLSQDLFQDVCMILLEYDNKKLNELHDLKVLKYWLIRVIKQQFYSDTSKFNRTYRSFELKFRNMSYNLTSDYNDQDVSYGKLYDAYEKMSDTTDRETKELIQHREEVVDKILKEIHWFDYTLYCLYYKKFDFCVHSGKKRDKDCQRPKSTFRRLEFLTGIDHNSIHKSVKATEAYLKKRLDEIK